MYMFDARTSNKQNMFDARAPNKRRPTVRPSTDRPPEHRPSVRPTRYDDKHVASLHRCLPPYIDVCLRHWAKGPVGSH